MSKQMARFHSLEVTDLRKTISDAVVVTLRPDDPDAFDFTQGQYLTFRRNFDGTEVRRCYSICAGKDDGVLQVGIKRVDGGAFSTFANTELKIGDRLEVMPPMGTFFTPIEPQSERHYLGFAGGSGITPLLSLIKTMLAREPNSRFTLVYANRAVNSIMFREELEDIKNLNMGRFNVLHVLESDAQDVDLLTGRVDAKKCELLFSSLVDVTSIDTAFICGPEPMMLTIAQALRDDGMPEDRIKFELFASGQPGRVKRRVGGAGNVTSAKPTSISVTIDGAKRTFTMDRDQAIVDAALEQSIDVPYSCKAGVCSTCRCRLTEGSVEMMANHALQDDEIAQGYILSCQALPTSDAIAVDYDH